MSSSLSSGQRYKFTNVKGGTILDLSGGDNRSLIGYEDHGGDNQRWILENGNDNQWFIKNAQSGQYINVDGQPQNGAALIVGGDQFVWNIWPDERDQSHFRIFDPNTDLNFDLADHGNPTPGTKVQLWDKTPGKGQTWIIEEA
ncbi:hypothetical protein HWV62_12590 [Athelia sp. TMB]|nr:hypothetical protein HWV62_12590 [Athelia sp. TMB]